MNFFGVTGIFIFLTSFILGVFILLKSHKTRIHTIWGIFSLAVAIWGGGVVLISRARSPEEALLFWRLTHIGIILIPVLFYSFVQSFLGYKSLIGKLIVYGLGACFSLINITDILGWSNLFIRHVRYVFNQFYYDSSPSILYALFVVFFVIAVLYAHIQLGSRYGKSKGIIKKQIEYFFLATIVGFSGGSLSFLPVFGLNVYPAFNFTVALYPVIMTVGILQYHLFDTKIIIKRTVVYSGLLLFSLGTYSMIVFFFTAFFGGGKAFDPRSFITNLIAATLIATGFEPIRKYLTNITDKYLFKGEYDPQTILANLSKDLSASVDMKEATQSLVTLIKTEMRLTHAAVITFSFEEAKPNIKEITYDGYEDPHVLQLAQDSPLLAQMAASPSLITADDLHERCQVDIAKDPRYAHDPIGEACQRLLLEMESLHVAVAIPILVIQ